MMLLICYIAMAYAASRSPSLASKVATNLRKGGLNGSPLISLMYAPSFSQPTAVLPGQFGYNLESSRLIANGIPRVPFITPRQAEVHIPVEVKEMPVVSKSEYLMSLLSDSTGLLFGKSVFPEIQFEVVVPEGFRVPNGVDLVEYMSRNAHLFPRSGLSKYKLSKPSVNSFMYFVARGLLGLAQSGVDDRQEELKGSVSESQQALLRIKTEAMKEGDIPSPNLSRFQDLAAAMQPAGVYFRSLRMFVPRESLKRIADQMIQLMYDSSKAEGKVFVSFYLSDKRGKVARYARTINGDVFGFLKWQSDQRSGFPTKVRNLMDQYILEGQLAVELSKSSGGPSVSPGGVRTSQTVKVNVEVPSSANGVIPTVAPLALTVKQARSLGTPLGKIPLDSSAHLDTKASVDSKTRQLELDWSLDLDKRPVGSRAHSLDMSTEGSESGAESFRSDRSEDSRDASEKIDSGRSRSLDGPYSPESQIYASLKDEIDGRGRSQLDIPEGGFRSEHPRSESTPSHSHHSDSDVASVNEATSASLSSENSSPSLTPATSGTRLKSFNVDVVKSRSAFQSPGSSWKSGHSGSSGKHSAAGAGSNDPSSLDLAKKVELMARLDLGRESGRQARMGGTLNQMSLQKPTSPELESMVGSGPGLGHETTIGLGTAIDGPGAAKSVEYEMSAEHQLAKTLEDGSAVVLRVEPARIEYEPSHIQRVEQSKLEGERSPQTSDKKGSTESVGHQVVPSQMLSNPVEAVSSLRDVVDSSQDSSALLSGQVTGETASAAQVTASATQVSSSAPEALTTSGFTYAWLGQTPGDHQHHMNTAREQLQAGGQFGNVLSEQYDDEFVGFPMYDDDESSSEDKSGLNVPPSLLYGLLRGAGEGTRPRTNSLQEVHGVV